jgi:hypothetical protein
MALLSPVARQQFFVNGAPAANHLLYTYAANTTTPQATYSDRNGTIPNTNPIVLDAEGRTSTGVYLPSGLVYDYVFKTDLGVTVYTQEDVEGDPLASDLGSSSPTMGAALVAFQQAGTGSVLRDLYRKTGENLSALDFIPVAEHAAIRARTSTYDCAADLADAYTEAKVRRCRLVLPAGLYCVGTTITIDGQASFVGEGCSGSNLDLETVLNLGVTVIRWIGASGGTVINQVGRIGGIEISDFAIDCNNLANIGLQLDRLTYSKVSSIKIVSWRADQVSTAGLLMKVQPDFSADNIMFNQIGPLYLRGPTCCLRLATTNSALGNVCHNTFDVTVIDCRGGTSNNGIIIEDADNNSFTMTYTYVPSGSDYGMNLQPLARSNYFWQYQGSIYAVAGSKNTVFGFDRENGQPQPTLEATAELFWTENGNNASSWNLTSAMANLQARLVGIVSTAGTGPGPSYFDINHPASGARLRIGYGTSSGASMRVYSSKDGGGFTSTAMEFENDGLVRYRLGGRVHTYAPSIPVAGTWGVGDIAFNTAPIAGGTVGWVCVTAGSPGTWKTFGAIAA